LPYRFTDTESYFVSEASVYRLLKALDLIASPAFKAEIGTQICYQTGEGSRQDGPLLSPKKSITR